MKAALVRSFEQPPEYGQINAPEVAPGEVLVSTRAAAISQLVRAQASGRHYSSGKTFPQVPGSDGVGVLPDGQRVYFAFPRPPLGTMAETVAIKQAHCVPIPDDVDDVTAAAIANPGMSSVAALEARAGFQRGESVLINGAAGSSGRLAIQIARHLGASRIVATARSPDVESELRALGADTFVNLSLSSEALTAAFREEIEAGRADVVLDYLWGTPATCLIEAASGHGAGAARPRVRLVNIGSLAGGSISLPANDLRSSGLEMMGSGLGSVSHEHLVQLIGKLLQWVKPARLEIATRAVPLSEVRGAWGLKTAERVVLTV